MANGETGIGGLEREQNSQKQSGCQQQKHGQRDLGYQRNAAKNGMRVQATQGESGLQTGAAGTPGGRNAEEQRGKQSQGYGGGYDSPVGREIEAQGFAKSGGRQQSC